MSSAKLFNWKLLKMLEGPWNYVNGSRCNSAISRPFMEVTEPATSKVLCKVAISGTEDVDSAVFSAREAFKEWRKVSARQRGQYLIKGAQLLRQNLEDIAKLEVRDSGKPIWEAKLDIASVADALEYFGGISSSLMGQSIPLEGGSLALVTREPFGVVAGIGAWNFPMQTCAWKLAPCLAAGNTFVYKPSQFTPVTAVTLAEIMTAAGLPNGVFNVVQGEGETGAMLSNHPEVSKVSFTGSVPTGTKIMEASAKHMKAITLELGGKSPLIIFEDCDIKNAVKASLMANFLSQGQVCSNGTRVFVQKSIMKEFQKLLVEQTLQMKAGNPFEESTTIGATIHESHAKKVLDYIKGASHEGAEIVCGGERILLSGELTDGWYLSPCILSNCRDDMKVVKEEVFGSVLVLLPFDSEEEAVERANNTEFGLAGGVFTKDIQRGHRVANSIEAGTVWINTYNFYPPELPFGGFKKSGVGRENGTWALDNFTQTKTIYIEMGDVDCGPLYQE